MQDLTINKSDLKRQLKDELADIRSGCLSAVATAMLFTKDDRYTITVRVEAHRLGYRTIIRTYLGGESTDGNTQLIHTHDGLCCTVADIVALTIACAGCADSDAEQYAEQQARLETTNTTNEQTKQSNEGNIMTTSTVIATAANTTGTTTTNQGTAKAQPVANVQGVEVRLTKVGSINAELRKVEHKKLAVTISALYHAVVFGNVSFMDSWKRTDATLLDATLRALFPVRFHQ